MAACAELSRGFLLSDVVQIQSLWPHRVVPWHSPHAAAVFVGRRLLCGWEVVGAADGQELRITSFTCEDRTLEVHG